MIAPADYEHIFSNKDKEKDSKKSQKAKSVNPSVLSDDEEPIPRKRSTKKSDHEKVEEYEVSLSFFWYLVVFLTLCFTSTCVTQRKTIIDSTNQAVHLNKSSLLLTAHI
jgi:hypothetical protein